MDKKKRELLEQADWDIIIPSLLKYTLNKLRWRFFYDNSPLGGMDINQIAQDQVMGAIGKLWDETVSWDYEKKDNLLYYIQSGIKSQISHLFDNDEYLTTERFPVAFTDGSNKATEIEEVLKKANPQEEHARDITPSTPPNPEKALLDKEQEEEDKAATDALLERLKGDKELEDVVWCIMAEITKPQEIAKEMGVEVKHVNNLQKKLRRAYKDLQEHAGENAMTPGKKRGRSESTVFLDNLSEFLADSEGQDSE